MRRSNSIFELSICMLFALPATAYLAYRCFSMIGSDFEPTTRNINAWVILIVAIYGDVQFLTELLQKFKQRHAGERELNELKWKTIWDRYAHPATTIILLAYSVFCIAYDLSNFGHLTGVGVGANVICLMLIISFLSKKFASRKGKK